MTLPFFTDANYILTRESPECQGEFREREDGMVTVGWELRVPEPGPDGVPFLFIFVGPTSEHCGSAFRLGMKGAPDSASVLVHCFYKTGSERSVIFEGRYGDLEEAVGVQRRVEAGQDYVIRVGVTVPGGGPEPDPAAEESFFELECVKLWWNETA